MSSNAPDLFPHVPTKDELLTQARLDVEHALAAINRDEWLKANVFLKLAIDQIADVFDV